MIDLDYKAIGKRVKTARKKAKITQEKLADAVDITPPHMSNIETGNTKVSLPTLIRIANELHTTLDSLVADNLIKNRIELHRDVEAILDHCDPIEYHILLDVMQAFHDSYQHNQKQ